MSETFYSCSCPQPTMPARRSLLIAAAIQPDSLDIVLTRLLVSRSTSRFDCKLILLSKSARFLTFDRRITECWSQLGAAVRTAQALGLHRDGSNMVRWVSWSPIINPHSMAGYGTFSCRVSTANLVSNTSVRNKFTSPTSSHDQVISVSCRSLVCTCFGET